MSKKSFRGALNQLDLHKKTKEAEIPGILGFTVNGSQVVNVPYRPGYVYVRLRNNTSEVIQAFNENINALYNLPVIVVRDEVDRSRYKIKGRDLGAYQNWGTSNLYVGDHTHSFFTGFLAFDDAVFIATGVALDFKEDLYATAAGTTISVGVVTGTFSRDGHTHPQYSTGSAVVGGGTADLLIYDDHVFKVTGTALDFGANINVVVTGSVAYISSVDTVGGGGGADLLIYDNALFKVTGTALNFGDNLDVVVTGTTAYITAVGVTGSTGQQGQAGADGDNTLLIYDDLIFKVTGTTLAFGNNINVVVTGSTAYISSVDTVGGGGGSDLLIYDDSVFKVTGSAISFNNNLSVAVTGTTAFVDASAGGVSNWQYSFDPKISQSLYSSGTWSRGFWNDVQAQFYDGYGIWNSSGNQYNALTWKVPLSAGTWSISLYVRKSTNTGIATLKIDEASVGTLDTYAGSASAAKLTLTGVSIATSDIHTFEIVIATKNGSSTGYYFNIFAVDFLRTA